MNGHGPCYRIYNIVVIIHKVLIGNPIFAVLKTSFMKRLVLSALATIFCMQVMAQAPAPENKEPRTEVNTKKHSRHAAVYFNLSTGINNNAGMLGIGLEVPVVDQFSVEAGLGSGSWGRKYYFCTKYYLRPSLKGWAFGPGFSYCPGISKYTINLETVYSDSEPVDMHLDPQTNIFVGAYNNWRLGRRNNRIYLQLGYSVPLGPAKFYELYGDPITDNSRNTMKLLSPGGLIVAFAFSFGAGGR
jgi:hypothetical protein